MNDTVIVNIRGLEPGDGVIAAWVRIREGKIVEIGPHDTTPHDGAELLDGGGPSLRTADRHRHHRP